MAEARTAIEPIFKYRTPRPYIKKCIVTRVILEVECPTRATFREQKIKAKILSSLNPHHLRTRFLTFMHPPNMIMIIHVGAIEITIN